MCACLFVSLSLSLCMCVDGACEVAQVLMTRFQRLTFYTLYRYFGLTKELLRGEDARREHRPPKVPHTRTH
jgi:hypothetical protein